MRLNTIMNSTIIRLACLGGVFLLSNCTTVVRPPATQTTTTEETTISRPYSSTVETQTTRRY